VHEIAQTNLQLYNQLVARGWPDDELARARRAYELATELFAGQMRPSGKTFVAHVVGVASIVATCTDDREAVLAALVHAAYTHGDFGGARRGIGDRRRREVRAAIGPEAESLVAAYAQRGYSPAVVEEWVTRGATLTGSERRVATLRIANEIEDRLDLGTRYADRRGHEPTTDPIFTRLLTFAAAVSEPALTDLARRTASAVSAAVVPAVLARGAARSTRLAPRSYRRRLVLRARSALRPLRLVARYVSARARRLVPERPATGGAPSRSTIVGATSTDDTMPASPAPTPAPDTNANP
jgi:hypothetical protein